MTWLDLSPMLGTEGPEDQQVKISLRFKKLQLEAVQVHRSVQPPEVKSDVAEENRSEVVVILPMCEADCSPMKDLPLILYKFEIGNLAASQSP